MDVPLILRFLSIVTFYQAVGSKLTAPFPELVQTENDAIAPWYLSAGVQSRPSRPASSEYVAPQGYFPGHLVEHTPSHRAIEPTNPLPHIGAAPEGSSRRIASAAQEGFNKEFFPSEPDVEEPSVGSPDYINTQISNIERYMPLLARKLGLLGRNLTTMSPEERRTTPTPPKKFTRITKSRKLATKVSTASPEDNFMPRGNTCLDGSCSNSTAFPITRETTEPTNEAEDREDRETLTTTETSSPPKFRNTKLVAVRRFLSTTETPVPSTSTSDPVIATLPTLPPPPVDEVDEKPEIHKGRPEKPEKEKWTGDKPWTHSAGPRGPCPPPSTEWSAFWAAELVHSKSIASTELIDAIRGALDKFRETLNRSDVHDDMRQVGSQLESTWNELRKGAWVERAFAELATLSDATSSERQKIAEGSFNEAVRQRLEDFRNRILQEQTRLNSVIDSHSLKSVPSVSEGASSRERHNRGLHRIQLR